MWWLKSVKCDVTVLFMTKLCSRIILQTGLFISVSHSWLLLSSMPDTKGNMTNVSTSSQEPSSFFFSGQRVRSCSCAWAVRVAAVIYGICSRSSLTWTAGGRKPLRPTSFFPLQWSVRTTTTPEPGLLVRILESRSRADPVHAQSSQQLLCSPAHT